MLTYSIVLCFTLHRCFSQLLQFFVINLKEYTGSIYCFLSLANSEPPLGKDQIFVYFFFLSPGLAQCLDYNSHSINLFLFKLNLPQSNMLLLRPILLMCHKCSRGKKKKSSSLEAKYFKLFLGILFCQLQKEYSPQKWQFHRAALKVKLLFFDLRYISMQMVLC